MADSLVGTMILLIGGFLSWELSADVVVIKPRVKQQDEKLQDVKLQYVKQQDKKLQDEKLQE